MNACLNFTYNVAGGYIEGYKMAADALIEGIHENRGRGIDFLVFPVCFLYRHYIEIQLKELIHTFGLLHDKPEAKEYLSKPRHSLKDLWQKFKEMNVELDQIDPDDLQRMNEIIVELDAFDPGGTTFRYHKDIKSGKISLRHRDNDRPTTYCNLDALYEEMQILHSWLDAGEAYFKDQLQMKWDMT